MKLKEIDRTANVAWSPVESSAIYLAAGTAAQQLDSSFSSNATLELYFFDINQSGLDVPLNASIPCETRFHKIIWGSHGMTGKEEGEHPSGVIVAGCDGGVMQVYDAAKILTGEDPLVLTKNKHTGPVRALDFNSFRPNVVASGASDSEIYIWDLISPKTAMTTGTKSQPPDDVTHLAWNKQVEHILASTFSNRCVMWDLRKNEPIIKVADTAARTRYKAVEWHPTVATQMALASEDDTSPVIQLWDLRYATAPLKVLQGHQRGVLALSWCRQDPELLLSCGKDSNILCWNPNFPHAGYELIGEIPTTSQWSFDVAFCPRNPLIISSSSFEGRVSIFGMSGGAQQAVTTSKLADSFPGMDMASEHTPVPSQKPVAFQLRDAPKWLKRPVGASFAFGGKLIKFENSKNQQQAQGVPDQRLVTISQVVTLPDFLIRSQKLESSLQSGNLAEFCDEKAGETLDENEAEIWRYLRASFSTSPNFEYLNLLGFSPNEIHAKLSLLVGDKGDGIDGEVGALTDGFMSLAQGDSFGNQFNSTDQANEDGTKSSRPESPGIIRINTEDNSEGHLNQALLSGNVEYAVELCMRENQWPEAFILASSAGPVLTKKVQDKYLNVSVPLWHDEKHKSETTELIRVVVSQDWRRLVERCDLANWQQALATLLTYVTNENDFSWLAGTLGQRLEASKDLHLQNSAMVCYICSGNMDRLADSWTNVKDMGTSTGPDSLQDLVEQITVLRKSAEVRGKRETLSSGPLASKMVEYATLLASQGSLELALKYLVDSSDPSMVNLRERIQYALGYQYQRPRGVVPRSRQSSESGSVHRGPAALTQKRPSYTSSINQPLFQPAATTNLANGYGSSQQFNPPPSVPAPVAPPPASSTLPLPPVSSAAPGWNDPPALLKAKVKASKPVERVEPITHPIFGSGPVPSQESFPGPPKPPGPGAPSMFQPSAAPPPQNPSSAFASRPPLGSSSGAHSAPAPQLYNPSAVTGQPTGLPPMPGGGGPPPMSGGYGAPPPVSSFNPGMPPPSGNIYNPSQSSQPGFHHAQPPPPAGAFNPGPPPTAGFTPGPPPKGGFTSGPGGINPLSRGAAATSTSPANNMGQLPPTFTPGPPQMGGGYGQSTGLSSMGGLGQQSAGLPGGPPPSFLSGPPQLSGFNSQQGGLPGGPPPSTFTPGPPPASSFNPGPPPTSGFNAGPPPSSGFTPGPPHSTGFAPGPPPSSGFNAGPPPSSGFNAGPPPSSGFNAGPPPSTGFPPGPPPPSSGFSAGPPPTSGFNAGPPPSSGFSPGPPPPSSGFSAGPPPSSGFTPGPPPATGFAPGLPPGRGLSATPSGGLSSAQPPAGSMGASPFGGPPPSSAFPPPPVAGQGALTNPPRAISPAMPGGPTSFMPPPASAGLPTAGARLSRPPSSASGGPRPPSVQGSDSGAPAPWDSQPLAPPSVPLQTQPPPQVFSPPPSGAFSAPPAMNQTSPSPSLGSGGAPKAAEPAVLAREAMESQPKGPVPDEHKDLVEVLEKLRSECYNVAALPQIKRKLEDVARKLEIMKEKLREGSLSANTLSSLHSIVNALNNRDYQLALSIHTQLVTAGNFAEISSFLPSIKVLIQSAASLNVFL